MKILQVTPSYFPAFRFGGPTQSVHLLNKELIRQGQNIEVITTPAGIAHDRMPILNKQILQEGVPVTYYPFSGYEHYNFSPDLFKAVWKSVQQKNIVHITAVWNFPVAATAFACRWFKIPYVLSPRGTIYAETIAHRSANLKKLYYNLISFRDIKGAAALHFTSQDEADKVSQVFGLNQKNAIIPNGIDLTEFSIPDKPLSQWIPFPIDPQKKYLLFLGRIDKKKGLDQITEAFPIIAHKYPETQLILAGPDNEGYGNWVKAQFQNKISPDRIIWTGPVEGKTKIALYYLSSLFLLPSYSENFGMSVVEALACNCPVIISDKVGLWPGIKSSDAGWVIPNDAKALVESISQALDNPKIALQKGLNGNTWVKNNFDIQKIGTDFIHLYQQLRK